MKTKIKNKILSIAIIVSLFVLNSPSVYAADTLVSPKDMLSNSDLGAYSEHSISFGLPENSQPILKSDYVIIDMPYFTNITEPTYLHGGYTGNPTYRIANNRITITNIAVLPGSFITIAGIVARNPQNADLFDVNINIASNSNGFGIKNSANIIATDTEGSVMVYASVDPVVGVLRISGLSSPNMFITFSEDATVIGTTVSDNSGHFAQTFPGISPVVHRISIYGSDNLNRVTPPSYVEIFTRPYELTQVTDVVLAPTISLDKDQINRGDAITIAGTGVPNYKTVIFTEPPLSSFEVINDQSGNYSYTLTDTADFQYGDHKAYALVQDGTGAQSRMSLSPIFKVVGSTTPPPEGNTPDFDISKGDLNGDTRVNLIDFSILLYFWNTNSPEADINGDNAVNLIDFSIMMYYWET